MGRPAFSILGLIIFLIIVVGAGILIYRFVVNDNTKAATIVINDDGTFALDEYKLKNDEVFKVENKSDENQTLKKSSDDSTLVEVNANSTSRELTLGDDSKTELYLSGDENEKTTLVVGTPKEESQTTDTNGQTQGESTPTPPASTAPLPNTGPANNLVYLLATILGFGLYKASKRLLN